MPSLASQLPPGPKSHPAWQTFRLIRTPLDYLEECSRRFGDSFTLRLSGYGYMVMLSDPEAVKEVLRADPEVLVGGEGNEFLSMMVGPTSVLVLDGSSHARQRRVLLPPLKGERMRSSFDAVETEAVNVAQSWPRGVPVRMDDPMRRITLRVILRATLGLDAGPLLDDLENKVHQVLNVSRGPYSLLTMRYVARLGVRPNRWMRFFRQLQKLDEALFAVIKASRAAPESLGRCVLADLLAAEHEDGRSLSDQEIRDAVVTLLVAGHETTSLAIAWALELIAPRPDVVERIRAEVEKATGGQPLRVEHLDQLDYLDAVIRESLRVRTLLSFQRRVVKQPFSVGGREYPAGVSLCPSNHLVHRREDLYPAGATFRPERFLERRFAPNEWFPFGGGGRSCVGMAFAMFEMKVVLSVLLTRLRLSRPAGAGASKPVRRGLMLAPHDGAAMIVADY